MARYVDIDLDFTRNPLTNDVSLLFNKEAVKRAVRNIVLTNMGEKPYKSEFGGNIKAQLFEQFNPITVLTLKTRIQKALETFERRVDLLKVEVTPNFDQNELTVSIVVKVINIPEPVTVDITLERIR